MDIINGNGFVDSPPSTSIGSIHYHYVLTDSCETIQVDIWDKVGREQFLPITQMFCEYAEAVIFVCDITNKNSFVDIKDNWYEKVKEFAHDNCIFAVFGNKMDLVEKEEVFKKEAKEYAESIGALWFLTSAKQGNYRKICSN